MIQTSLAIEHCAKEHKLGTFQKAYAEFPSPFFVLVQSILLGAVALGWIWITVQPLPQIMPFWIAVPLGMLVVLVLLGGVVYVWRDYAATKGRWLYLYNDGFVYDNQGQIQGYRLEDILSVDTHEMVNSSNGNSRISYTFHLVTGEHLKIKHGAELRSRLRER